MPSARGDDKRQRLRGAMEESEMSWGSSEKEEELEYIFDAVMNKTYLRRRFLGKGAHAMVYLATDVSEDVQKDYAIKIMNLEPPPEDSDDRKGRSREVRLGQVLREVDIHGLMRHANVVQLESYFRDKSRFYMVLEHCEMNTLAQLLRSRGRLEENETRRLLKQLLEGLKYIHDRGVIHRDLKPANIYLTRDMVLKIGDFGLADRIRTKSRGMCGTPNYISPEVLMEQGYTTAVDVWAVGCITYNMVCGRPPFEAETPAATYELIRAHRYSAVPSFQAGAALRHLISWMLAFQPEDRPTIPFILNHVWMRRNQEVMQGSWSRSHKKRKESIEKAPIAEITTETTLKPVEEAHEVSDGGRKEEVGEERREFSFWKSILEKAKIHTKVLSYEDVNNKPMFQHLRSRVYFAMTARKREPIKKVIEEVLKGMPIPRDEGGSDTSESPPFISKWIDYSNKYGFGYQMADGATGVFFNDSSQITLDGSKTNMTWCRRGKKVSYPVHSIPNQLQGKVLLLNYFADYMDNHLSSGATQDYREESRGRVLSLLRQWMRNDEVILFETTAGLLQINFFRDHYKMVFYQEDVKGEKRVILIVIDEEKKMRRYNLSKMGSRGCPEDVLAHLTYIYTII